MSEPIGPGDWVEWVGLPEAWNGPAQCPILGSKPSRRGVHQVRELSRPVRGLDGVIRPGLRLVGVRQVSALTGRELSWPVAAFRPIYRPKASVIEALKAPVARTPQVVKPIREGQKVNAQ